MAGQWQECDSVEDLGRGSQQNETRRDSVWRRAGMRFPLVSAFWSDKEQKDSAMDGESATTKGYQ